jgi:hypothetical protein
VAVHVSPVSLVTQFTFFDLVKVCAFISSALSAPELFRGPLLLLASPFCNATAPLGLPTPLYLFGRREFNPSLLLSSPRRFVCAGPDPHLQFRRAIWLIPCRRLGASAPVLLIAIIRHSSPAVGLRCQRSLPVWPHPIASTLSASRGTLLGSQLGASSEPSLHEALLALFYLIHAFLAPVFSMFITSRFITLRFRFLLPLVFLFSDQARSADQAPHSQSVDCWGPLRHLPFGHGELRIYYRIDLLLVSLCQSIVAPQSWLVFSWSLVLLLVCTVPLSGPAICIGHGGTGFLCI